MKWYKYQTGINEYIEFRLLSAEEADRFYKPCTSGNPYAEEFVFNAITNNKYDIDDLGAGIIPTVIYSSYKLSGSYSKQEELLDAIDNARKQFEFNVYHKIFYSKIMRIMQGTYNLEELKSKSLNELLELYVLCESMIDGKIHDTDKMREALIETSPTVKKGKGKVINSITPEMLASLKASLQAQEIDGLPIDMR